MTGTWRRSGRRTTGDINSIRSTGASFRATTGYWFSFDGLAAGEQVEVRMGISYVSTENARKNLDAEQAADARSTPSGNRPARAGTRLWAGIRVEGGAEQQQRVFYTALYHALLHPNS